MSRIAVVGSINMDLVVETDIIPKKGETVLGNHFFIAPGGKGANQAVAAARLGGNVTMFGSVGIDQNGETLRAILKEEGVETAFINIVEGVATGVAIIEICENDNRIIVAQGANQYTNLEYLTKVSQELLNYDVILLQHEIPMESIEYITNYLSIYNKTIILNPAPAFTLSEETLKCITYITPNEHEYKMVLNTSDDMDEVLKRFPNQLLITRGEEGVTYYDGKNIITVPSINVDIVDTTGAGDTFTGAFGVAISQGQDLQRAIHFANCAAGLSITKMGAQKGMPTLDEVLKIM
ncbi:ribokinase [Robertmurraya sp. DFI.2.37]|jgi:ribokinase|uniref:ribokinase n=1 Tax=Robertmurraya sp. DFI.2.37 TaxID=3031819 RepID=UPI0012455E36|nr:ribokinase [Robertmurraya sp. DFI.2.37]MDF1508863.1 ribokinase [Robertmurraya sp. DFI.2.37]